MNKDQIAASSAIPLFRHVFGLKQDQTLSDFVQECKSVKEDEAFVAEVRAYAIANAS